MNAAKKGGGDSRQKSDNFCGIDQLPLPSCAIIITHYNLASYLKDALISVINQTYQNWQCLVVDDASDDEQYELAQNIVDELSHPKVRLIRTQKNLGQTLAGFEGMQHTESQFVSFLDPDDRLLPEFLEEMIMMHLNPVIVAPYVCSNQFLKEENKGIIASLARSPYLIKRSGKGVEAIWKSPSSGHQLYFIEPSNPCWNRTANSSMLYRRSALEYCIPKKPLSMKNNADALMSWGCHFMGGTLFYDKPLVIRQITGANEFISQELISSL
ncbi:MAG: glycosyltransferase family 2 protein, partial [Pseudomonadota bacterium]